MSFRAGCQHLGDVFLRVEWLCHRQGRDPGPGAPPVRMLATCDIPQCYAHACLQCSALNLNAGDTASTAFREAAAPSSSPTSVWAPAARMVSAAQNMQLRDGTVSAAHDMQLHDVWQEDGGRSGVCERRQHCRGMAVAGPPLHRDALPGPSNGLAGFFRLGEDFGRAV